MGFFSQRAHDRAALLTKAKAKARAKAGPKAKAKAVARNQQQFHPQPGDPDWHVSKRRNTREGTWQHPLILKPKFSPQTGPQIRDSQVLTASVVNRAPQRQFTPNGVPMRRRDSLTASSSAKTATSVKSNAKQQYHASSSSTRKPTQQQNSQPQRPTSRPKQQYHASGGTVKPVNNVVKTAKPKSMGGFFASLFSKNKKPMLKQTGESNSSASNVTKSGTSRTSSMVATPGRQMPIPQNSKQPMKFDEQKQAYVRQPQAKAAPLVQNNSYQEVSTIKSHGQVAVAAQNSRSLPDHHGPNVMPPLASSNTSNSSRGSNANKSSPVVATAPPLASQTRRANASSGSSSSSGALLTNKKSNSSSRSPPPRPKPQFSWQLEQTFSTLPPAVADKRKDVLRKTGSQSSDDHTRQRRFTLFSSGSSQNNPRSRTDTYTTEGRTWTGLAVSSQGTQSRVSRASSRPPPPPSDSDSDQEKVARKSHALASKWKKINKDEPMQQEIQIPKDMLLQNNQEISQFPKFVSEDKFSVQQNETVIKPHHQSPHSSVSVGSRVSMPRAPSSQHTNSDIVKKSSSELSKAPSNKSDGTSKSILEQQIEKAVSSVVSSRFGDSWSPKYKLNDQVVAHGLKSTKHLNGKIGTVTDIDYNISKYVVEFPDLPKKGAVWLLNDKNLTSADKSSPSSVSQQFLNPTLIKNRRRSSGGVSEVVQGEQLEKLSSVSYVQPPSDVDSMASDRRSIHSGAERKISASELMLPPAERSRSKTSITESSPRLFQFQTYRKQDSNNSVASSHHSDVAGRKSSVLEKVNYFEDAIIDVNTFHPSQRQIDAVGHVDSNPIVVSDRNINSVPSGSSPPPPGYNSYGSNSTNSTTSSQHLERIRAIQKANSESTGRSSKSAFKRFGMGVAGVAKVASGGTAKLFRKLSFGSKKSSSQGKISNRSFNRSASNMSEDVHAYPQRPMGYVPSSSSRSFGSSQPSYDYAAGYGQDHTTNTLAQPVEVRGRPPLVPKSSASNVSKDPSSLSSDSPKNKFVPGNARSRSMTPPPRLIANQFSSEGFYSNTEYETTPMHDTPVHNEDVLQAPVQKDVYVPPWKKHLNKTSFVPHNKKINSSPKANDVTLPKNQESTDFDTPFAETPPPEMQTLELDDNKRHPRNWNLVVQQPKKDNFYLEGTYSGSSLGDTDPFSKFEEKKNRRLSAASDSSYLLPGIAKQNQLQEQNLSRRSSAASVSRPSSRRLSDVSDISWLERNSRSAFNFDVASCPDVVRLESPLNSHFDYSEMSESTHKRKDSCKMSASNVNLDLKSESERDEAEYVKDEPEYVPEDFPENDVSEDEKAPVLSQILNNIGKVEVETPIEIYNHKNNYNYNYDKPVVQSSLKNVSDLNSHKSDNYDVDNSDTENNDSNNFDINKYEFKFERQLSLSPKPTGQNSKISLVSSLATDTNEQNSTSSFSKSDANLPQPHSMGSFISENPPRPPHSLVSRNSQRSAVSDSSWLITNRGDDNDQQVTASHGVAAKINPDLSNSSNGDNDFSVDNYRVPVSKIVDENIRSKNFRINSKPDVTQISKNSIDTQSTIEIQRTWKQGSKAMAHGLNKEKQLNNKVCTVEKVDDNGFIHVRFDDIIGKGSKWKLMDKNLMPVLTMQDSDSESDNGLNRMPSYLEDSDDEEIDREIGDIENTTPVVGEPKGKDLNVVVRCSPKKTNVSSLPKIGKKVGKKAHLWAVTVGNETFYARRTALVKARLINQIVVTPGTIKKKLTKSLQKHGETRAKAMMRLAERITFQEQSANLWVMCHFGALF